MKNNIKKLLFDSGISNYRISKDTGIAQTTLSRFTRKESSIGNMSLNNAIKLNEYFLSMKEEIEMEKLFNEIDNIFIKNNKVNISYYCSVGDLLNDGMDAEILDENWYVFGNKNAKPSELNESFVIVEVEGTSDLPIFTHERKNELLKYLQENHKEYLKK